MPIPYTKGPVPGPYLRPGWSRGCILSFSLLFTEPFGCHLGMVCAVVPQLPYTSRVWVPPILEKLFEKHGNMPPPPRIRNSQIFISHMRRICVLVGRICEAYGMRRICVGTVGFRTRKPPHKLAYGGHMPGRFEHRAVSADPGWAHSPMTGICLAYASICVNMPAYAKKKFWYSGPPAYFPNFNVCQITSPICVAATP